MVQYVHPKKEGTKKEDKKERNRKEKERKGNEKKRKEMRNETKNKTCAQGASRVPTGQGCCLLARSVLLWWTNRRTKQKDQTEDKTRAGTQS